MEKCCKKKYTFGTHCIDTKCNRKYGCKNCCCINLNYCD